LCENPSVLSPNASRFSFVDTAGAAGALKLLFCLRTVAIGVQIAAIAVAHVVLDGPLPLRELSLIVGALALWNVLCYGSVRAVQDGEVVLHVAVDIAVFTALLYFTGGPTNPFVSLYLVPISLAATSLPARYAWLTVVLCGASYALLWWSSVPLPPVHARFGSEFDLHLAGMWINFVIAAVLIALFVGRMARLVRQRDDVGLRVAKEHGLGIGLLLSRAALQRFGGRLDLKDAPHGGVEAHIALPLDELLADAR
jgi:two-component system sensor histidine kinase RegB